MIFVAFLLSLVSLALNLVSALNRKSARNLDRRLTVLEETQVAIVMEKTADRNDEILRTYERLYRTMSSREAIKHARSLYRIG